jgi:crotonobetainyl-CoA:carnitine CoA-transferase CaiB-like acyl-CoA transferase
MDKTPPLAGIRVVELGHSVAAPYAGLVLAELGADVIKVERPGHGDDARGWGPPFVDGSGTMFGAFNRHKKSVEIDLKTEAGRAQIRELARGADVFIQNLRPGQAESIGLGAAALCAENPRLIYASVTAYGEEGPLAAKPGYDPLMQAFGGIMSVTGEEGRPSVRVGTSVVDMGSGMWVVTGVLAGLLRRTQTGRGGEVGASLYETALGWMVFHTPSYVASGKLPRKQGSGIAMVVPYQAFDAADGEIVIAAGNDNLFRRLAGALGHPEWAEDPRFANNAARVENRETLCPAIAALIRLENSETWFERLDAVGVPCAPVQTIDRVLSHPQTAALDILRRDPRSGATYMGLPLRFDGARPDREGRVPRLGEDNPLLDKSAKSTSNAAE